jgi:hypothetical protein
MYKVELMSKRRKAQEKPIHPPGLEVANLEIDTPPDRKQKRQSQLLAF